MDQKLPSADDLPSGYARTIATSKATGKLQAGDARSIYEVPWTENDTANVGSSLKVYPNSSYQFMTPSFDTDKAVAILKALEKHHLLSEKVFGSVESFLEVVDLVKKQL